MAVVYRHRRSKKRMISRYPSCSLSKKKDYIKTGGIKKKLKKFLALAVILPLFYAIFFSDLFAVKNLRVSGNMRLRSDEIEKFIVNEFSRKKVFLASRENIIFMDTETLQKSILDNFSILNGARIQKNFPNGLEITVQEKNISTIWCKTFCYWLDDDGVAYKPVTEQLLTANPTDGKNIISKVSRNILIIMDDSVSEIKPGDKIVDKNFLAFAKRVKSLLKEELNIDFDNIKTPGAVTDEIWVQTRQNWQIFFDVKGNANDEVLLLKQALKEKITSEEMKDLEYIDLRIKSKIFYKTRQNN